MKWLGNYTLVSKGNHHKFVTQRSSRLNKVKECGSKVVGSDLGDAVRIRKKDFRATIKVSRSR
jgi:hypothetical protein